MKKIFAIFLAFMCLLFVPCMKIQAAGFEKDPHELGNNTTEEDNIKEDDTEFLEKDETGHFINGWWKYHFRSDPWYCEDLYSEYTTVQSTEENGGYGYFTRGLYKNADGSYSFGYIFHVAGGNCIVSHEYHHEQTSNGVVTVGASEYLVRTVGPGFTYSCTPDYYQKAENNLFDTNLPVFNEDDEEGISNYVESGDYNSAVNSEDINSDTIDFDETVELPKNMRTYGKLNADLYDFFVSGNDYRVTVRWDVPSSIDTYSYDVQMRANYRYMNDNETYQTEWKSFVTNYPYETNSLYDLSTGEKVNRDSNIPEDFLITKDRLSELTTKKISGKDTPYSGGLLIDLATASNTVNITLIEVRVRNRVDGKYSNWVLETIHPDGNSYAYVTDDDGNTVDDDYYNGQNTNNSDMRDYYDTDNNSSNGNIDLDNISINGILGYIKSGFGLLGSGGIIALMSQTFSFLPKSIWTIITFYVSMLVVIALIAAVKEVIF